MAALIVAIGAAGASLVAGQAPAGAKAGQPELRVACVASANPTFRVTVANPGDRDLSILLGFTPATPQPQVVTALTVMAIRPATGANEEYVYVNPKYAAYTGRMDPWIVPLKAGATYDVEVPLKDFISSMNYNSLEPLVAAGARLVLEGRAVSKQPGRVWTGKVDTLIDACR